MCGEGGNRTQRIWLKIKDFQNIYFEYGLEFNPFKDGLVVYTSIFIWKSKYIIWLNLQFDSQWHDLVLRFLAEQTKLKMLLLFQRIPVAISVAKHSLPSATTVENSRKWKK